jgi:hypothetical protein
VVILQNYDEERVNEVLSVASAKNYGDGWIIKALREKWLDWNREATRINDYFEAVKVLGPRKTSLENNMRMAQN